MNVYGTNYWRGFLIRKCLKLRLSLIALFTFIHWIIGTKKDKRYACLLYCISTTLSFKFLFMFSSPFQDSLKFFFTYEQWIYVYFYLFHFIVCLFSSEGVGAVAAPFFRKCGENVAYRMLSFTLTHIPIAAIAANRLIIIVMFIFLKPFLSFFSILNHLHNHLSIPSFN